MADVFGLAASAAAKAPEPVSALALALVLAAVLVLAELSFRCWVLFLPYFHLPPVNFRDS